MPKYLDWYLVELESQIRERMRTDRVHSILRETEQHLTEVYEENLATGMSEEEAQLAAMERFGSPTKVAAAELGRSVQDENPRAANWAVGMVALAGTIVPATVGLATSSVAWGFCLVAVAGLTLAFATFAFFSRKLFLFPVAVIALASACTVALISSQRFVMETSLTTENLGGVIQELDREQLALQADLDLIGKSEGFFSGTPNRREPFALPSQQGFVVPLGLRYVRISAPVGYMLIVPRLSKGSVMDWTDAKRRWASARNLGHLTGSLAGTLTHLRSEKNRLTSFNSQFPTDVFSERIGESLAYGGMAIAVLWAINMFAFGLGRIGKKRRSGAWLEKRLA